MLKKLWVVVVIVGLCCVVASAQERGTTASSGIAEWLQRLQKKIAQIVPKKAMPQGTMVAGVRGAKEEASVKLYWKGKKGEEPVTEEEMLGFKKAVDLAGGGDRAAAIKELEGFMSQYPDSALIPDAKKTLDLVKAEPKAEVKEEKVPEVKAEVKDEKAREVKAEPKEEKVPEAPAVKTEGPKDEKK